MGARLRSAAGTAINCGAEYRGQVFADGSATVAVTGKREIKVRALLRLKPSAGPILIEVDGIDFLDLGQKVEDVDLTESKRYWFEEHTCPTNFVSDVVHLWSGDDADPHGLFELLDVVPAPPEHHGVPFDRPFQNGVFENQIRALVSPAERSDA